MEGTDGGAEREVVDHRGTSRRVGAGVLFALLGAVLAALLPAPAQAATADQVVVTGIGLTEPLEVTAEAYPDLCAALYREISWLTRGRGDSAEPDPKALGPQYTMVAHVDGEERHRFHVYPLADGGPRVFRPAEQPGDRTVREAWFHGRVSLPETLSAAGVPLAGYPPPNGAGGGSLAPPGAEPEPERGALAFLDDWREGMQLTLAITLAIVVGLAGVALLIRRRV